MTTASPPRRHRPPPVEPGEAKTLGAILVLAAILRLVQLGHEGLYYDECQSLFLARLPIHELILRSPALMQAPLYPLILKLVTQCCGGSEWVVRLPSLLAGLGSVLFCWLCGRRLLSQGAGLTAAFLMAINPMAIHYSHEARAYSLLMLGCVVSLTFGVALQERPRPRTAIMLVVVFLAMLYSHNLSLFFVVGVVLACLTAVPSGRTALLAWAAVTGATVLGYLPWVPQLKGQLAVIRSSYAWADSIWKEGFPWQVGHSLIALTHGALMPIRNRAIEPQTISVIALAVAILLVVGAFAARRGLRLYRSPTALTLALLLPLLGQFLYCWVRRTPSYVAGKSEAAALPFLVLLLAAGTVSLRPRLRWTVLLALAGLAILPLEVHWRFDFRSQEKMLAATIRQARAPEEVLISTFHHYCLLHYLDLRPAESCFLFPTQAYQHPDWIDWSKYDETGIAEDAATVVEDAVAASRQRGAGRLWVELFRELPHVDALEDALDARLVPLGSREFPQLRARLSCYLIPPLDPARPE